MPANQSGGLRSMVTFCAAYSSVRIAPIGKPPDHEADPGGVIFKRHLLERTVKPTRGYISGWFSPVRLRPGKRRAFSRASKAYGLTFHRLVFAYKKNRKSQIRSVNLSGARGPKQVCKSLHTMGSSRVPRGRKSTPTKSPHRPDSFCYHLVIESPQALNVLCGT